MSFRSLSKKNALDVYYRNGQGFALIPKIRAAKVYIWRDKEEPEVVPKNRLRWLRDGDRIQIRIEGRVVRPERPFVFRDLEPQSPYNGAHRYPTEMPTNFREALRDFKTKPAMPSRIIGGDDELIGFLSYSPALGYCLQAWKGNSVYAITHHGARSTRLAGPNSTRMERDLRHDFMILDSFDLVQFGEEEPFEVDYVKRGTFTFNDDYRVVRRAIMADYAHFLKAMLNPDHTEADIEGEVAYRIRYNANLKGFSLELLCDSTEGIHLLPYFHTDRVQTIQSKGDSIKLPLKGYPIIQIGTARPLIINMNWLRQLAKQWAQRNDRMANEADVHLTGDYDILGITLSADRARAKRAYRRKAKEHHPNRNPNDPDAEARFKAVNAAWNKIRVAKGWD